MFPSPQSIDRLTCMHFLQAYAHEVDWADILQRLNRLRLRYVEDHLWIRAANTNTAMKQIEYKMYFSSWLIETLHVELGWENGLPPEEYY